MPGENREQHKQREALAICPLFHHQDPPHYAFTTPSPSRRACEEEVATSSPKRSLNEGTREMSGHSHERKRLGPLTFLQEVRDCVTRLELGDLDVDRLVLERDGRAVLEDAVNGSVRSMLCHDL
jgi:hypothetical protein